MSLHDASLRRIGRCSPASGSLSEACVQMDSTLSQTMPENPNANDGISDAPSGHESQQAKGRTAKGRSCLAASAVQCKC